MTFDEVLVPVKQSTQFYVECPRFKNALFKVSFAQCRECKYFKRHSLESDDIVCSWKDCVRRSFLEKQKVRYLHADGYYPEYIKEAKS